ncbi:MAG: sigma-70 family RNA polymerase sigma factor [Acidobacteria bacterium]|nr:sigma-70 family RNA polymerase sigma factor [Acidobacteriota bacterium]
MNQSHPAVPPYDAESYLTILITEVRRRVRFLRNLAVENRDDVAQMAIEAYLRRPDEVRENYPEPGVWAGLKVASAAIDHGRRNAAQRGAGARGTRQVIGFDPQHEAVDHMFSDPTDPVAALLDHEVLAPILRVLTPADRTLFCLVEGYQYTNREAGRILGLSDSATSKRLKRIRAQVRELVIAA